MLPIFSTQDKDVALLQTSWAKEINPVLGNPISSGSVLTHLVLASGDNVINHKLGRKLQGWIVVGNTAAVSFYDKQAANSMPQKTLVLNASGAVTINLYVF